MKRILFALAFLSISSVSFAQVQAQPGQLYKWDFPTAEAATIARFEVKADAGAFASAGKVTADDASTVSGQSSFSWVIPALPNGAHTFTVRACSLLTCGVDTSPFLVAVVVISTPTNQRITPPPFLAHARDYQPGVLAGDGPQVSTNTASAR